MPTQQEVHNHDDFFHWTLPYLEVRISQTLPRQDNSTTIQREGGVLFFEARWAWMRRIRTWKGRWMRLWKWSQTRRRQKYQNFSQLKTLTDTVSALGEKIQQLSIVKAEPERNDIHGNTSNKGSPLAAEHLISPNMNLLAHHKMYKKIVHYYF